MENISEAIIENACLEWLNDNGWFAWKCKDSASYDESKGKYLRPTGYRINGVSDIISIKGSNVVFIEFKTKKGKQSKHQKVFESRIVEQGGTYVIIRSLSELIRWERQYEEKMRTMQQ